jgi:hypothetical protein
MHAETVTDDENSSDDDGSSDDERRVESVYDLLKAFSLTLSIKNLPSEKKRSDCSGNDIIGSSANGRRALETMVNIALQVLELSVKIIFPGDPDFLLNGVKEKLHAKLSEAGVEKKLVTADKLVTHMAMLLKSLSNGTFGYRVIRAILVESGSHNVLKNVSPPTIFQSLGPGQGQEQKMISTKCFSTKEILNS